MFFLFDPLYIVLIVATLVISGGAQLYIRSTYGKWDRVPNQAVLNGAQVAEVLRDRARFGNGTGQQAITAIQVVQGQLSDHFDPRDRSLSLSQAVATRPSVASMAISAHEVGHAAQLAEGSAWMRIRSVLVPAATIGPQFAYLFILGGLFFNLTGLFTLGILIFGICGAVHARDTAGRDPGKPEGAVDARVDGHHHDAAGALGREVDVDGRRPDVPRSGGHVDPDAALLHHAGAPQQLTSDAAAHPGRGPDGRARARKGACRTRLGHGRPTPGRDRGGRLDGRRSGDRLRPVARRAARRRGGRSSPLRRLTERAVRLEEPPSGLATVILLATDWPDDLERARRTRCDAPGRDVRRGRRRWAVRRAGGGLGRRLRGRRDLEIVWTSERLGHGAATNIGIRRATGRSSSCWTRASSRPATS